MLVYKLIYCASLLCILFSLFLCILCGVNTMSQIMTFTHYSYICYKIQKQNNNNDIAILRKCTVYNGLMISGTNNQM